MKRLKFFLSVWDGFWSIPLSVFIFFVIGWAGQRVFGRTVGFYDPSVWQTVFLAAGIIVAFNFITWFVLWFNFRSVFKYFIGTREEAADGKVTITNKSKEDVKAITPWQRLKISLFLYLYILLQAVIVLRILIK